MATYDATCTKYDADGNPISTETRQVTAGSPQEAFRLATVEFRDLEATIKLEVVLA